MSTTTLTEVANQIQKMWAPMATNKLRETLLLAELVNKDYEGLISSTGTDTVYVSQVDELDGQNLTVGTNADSFDTELVTTTRVAVPANKRAVTAVKFADLVSLQSQIDQDSVRDAMIFALNKQINTYLYSLVVPSASAPDHTTTGVTALAVADLGATRVKAGEAKWDNSKPWYGLLSPAYHGDLAINTTIASGDFTEGKTIVSGQVPRRLMGFEHFEDTSRTGDYGLWFHPDFLYFVRQTEIQVKISDLHALGQFGVIMSVDIVYGAILGIDGAKKCITITS